MNRRDYLKGLAASALLLKISPAWNVADFFDKHVAAPRLPQEANAPEETCDIASIHGDPYCNRGVRASICL